MDRSVDRKWKMAKRGLAGLNKRIGGAGRGVAAAMAGVVLFAANLGKSLFSAADELRDKALGNNKKSGEAVEMRKSTVIALMVALAAVAGVLGALYFYVLRRERELDEYEQLLFSEDFGDDTADGEPAPQPEEAEA